MTDVDPRSTIAQVLQRVGDEFQWTAEALSAPPSVGATYGEALKVEQVVGDVLNDGDTLKFARKKKEVVKKEVKVEVKEEPKEEIKQEVEVKIKEQPKEEGVQAEPSTKRPRVEDGAEWTDAVLGIALGRAQARALGERAEKAEKRAD